MSCCGGMFLWVFGFGKGVGGCGGSFIWGGEGEGKGRERGGGFGFDRGVSVGWSLIGFPPPGELGVWGYGLWVVRGVGSWEGGFGGLGFRGSEEGLWI